MKKEFGKCPICNRIYLIDIDGAMIGHNKKGMKEITIEALCEGSHKFRPKAPRK
jgi:hypothetical protein